ncbi:MAG: tRNA preQ1(34) S-adenosylmethionine ribosyltransferase-isomerase QueA [Candidatus Eutrophobiaceae bacterium]
MRTENFNYELPEGLIARRPASSGRDQSRLLYLPTEPAPIKDHYFCDLPTLLRPGDLLILNDTRVLPARLFGNKATGGKVEILVERVLDTDTFLAQLRASKPSQIGTGIEIANGIILEVIDRERGFYVLLSRKLPVLELLHRHGHMPLPPYIDRMDDTQDIERYQTVYATRDGSVAAPTAGLHFTRTLLAKLKERNIDHCFVTLHVGAGTFQPVRTDNPMEHQMHSEWMELGTETASKIAETHSMGGRIVAVGTTAVRCLETAALKTHAGAKPGNGLRPYSGETQLFILPGFHFQVVDALITNFHLPRSTLLMLACALAGTERILATYRYAINARYRFYSYGDAMLIEKP